MTASASPSSTGYGGNDCSVPGTGPATPVDAATFTAGLLDFRTQVTAKSQNFGTYYVSGTTHTWIETPAFYTQSVNGTKMVDWFTSILNGTSVTQVGP